MTRRPGITLVEVLVAIFIMGVGMIALLTLFPLGAINIALALRDDRAAQGGANGASMANANNLRQDSAILAAFNQQINASPPLDPARPSSPIYVDLFYAPLSTSILNVSSVGVISRLAPSATYMAPGVKGNEYWFSLADDLNFDPNGVPTGNPTTVQRTGRYTWAYMLRRPRLGDANVVDMSVVVYADRVTQTQSGETAYPAQLGVPGAAANIGTSTITLNYTAGQKPSVRKGSWILDVTQDPYVYNGIGPVFITRGYFYRVVDAQDNGSNQIIMELQNPIKMVPTIPIPAPPPPNRPIFLNIVVMENVVEVFDRGTGYIP